MQDMLLSLPTPYRLFQFKFLLILLVLVGTCIGKCQVLAFEFDVPSTVIIDEPFCLGYRMKLDGSDELRWMVNITDLDGGNPETLNNGQIFQTTGFQGDVVVTINRTGLFLLKAVNPDFPSQIFATSVPNFAWESDEYPDPDDDDDDDDDDDGTGGGGEGTGGGGTGGGGTGGGDTGGGGTGGGDTGGGTGGGGTGGGGTGGPGGPDDPNGGGSSGTSTSLFNPSTTISTPSTTSTLRPSSSSSANLANSNSRTGLVAGLVTAGVIVFIMILAALIFCRRRKRPRGEGSKRIKRPLTFYRDRMIRAPTPPPPAIQTPMEQPIPSIMNPQTFPTYAGIGAGGGYNPRPFPHAPNSASTSGVQPGIREFILSPRGPRPRPSPSPGPSPNPIGQQGPYKEFILRSPRPFEDALRSPSYSKP